MTHPMGIGIVRHAARMEEMHIWVAVLLAACWALIQPAAGAAAQRVTGSVVDAVSGDPVMAAHVVLLDEDDDQLDDATTNEDGRFEVAAPRAGTFRIRVARLGYEEMVTDTVSIGYNELVTTRLRIGVAPVELPALTALTRSRDVINDLSYDALYARRSLNRAVGSNRIFVKNDPEIRNSIRPIDVLHWVKPRKEVQDRRTGEIGPCLPIVIWHGFLVGARVLAQAILDGSTDDLEGLESYRDYASMPLGVRTELGTKKIGYMVGSLQSHIRDCGVVVLWPRRPDYPK